MVNNLDYKGIKFLVSRKDFGKIEKKNNVCINIFCYKNNLVYPVYIHQKGCIKFNGCMDFLLIRKERGSYYAYI